MNASPWVAPSLLPWLKNDQAKMRRAPRKPSTAISPRHWLTSADLPTPPHATREMT